MEVLQAPQEPGRAPALVGFRVEAGFEGGSGGLIIHETFVSTFTMLCCVFARCNVLLVGWGEAHNTHIPNVL